VERVEVLRQAIGLDYPAVLGLLWRHTTLGVIDGALGEVARLAPAEGRGALGVLDRSR
jgi:hypothetical protein